MGTPATPTEHSKECDLLHLNSLSGRLSVPETQNPERAWFLFPSLQISFAPHFANERLFPDVSQSPAPYTVRGRGWMRVHGPWWTSPLYHSLHFSNSDRASRRAWGLGRGLSVRLSLSCSLLPTVWCLCGVSASEWLAEGLVVFTLAPTPRSPSFFHLLHLPS